MVKADEIRDEESLRAWLEGRPEAAAIRLAHRSAARVLPVIETRLRTYRGSYDFEAQSARAVLAVIRFNLILQVLAFRTHAIPVDRLISRVDFAEHEWLSIEDIFDPAVGASLLAPVYALVAAILAGRPDAHFAHDDPTTLLRVKTFQDALLVSLRSSAMLKDFSQPLRDRSDPDQFSGLAADMEAALSDRPSAIVLTEQLTQVWSAAREDWQTRGEAWNVWIDWYENLLAGSEPDWTFLTRVALIPNEVWELGPAAVAEAIARIERGHAHRRSRPDPPHDAVSSGALAQNARAVRSQLDTLKAFVEGEIEQLRRPNDLAEPEHAARLLRLEMLAKIVEAVALMREAFDDAAPPATNALVVVDQQLPAVVNNAQAAVEAGGDVQVSGAIISMAAAIRHLTESGASAKEATAIAFVDYCVSKLKLIMARR